MGLAVHPYHSDLFLPYLPIRLPSAYTAAQFADLCALNPELRIERTAQGNIVVMPPTHTLTGSRNADLFGEIYLWNKKNDQGKLFDPSTGFTLPNSAVRSPDVAWVEKNRWDALSEEEKNTFAAVCPDFVLELRSSSDNLPAVREKMEEYIQNGCQLGWLVDFAQRQTYVYRSNGSIEIVSFAQNLDGGEVLPGLSLRLSELFPE